MKLPIAAAALVLSNVAAIAASSPLGVWSRGDGKATVRIEPCGAALCAINTWIKPGTDDEKVGDRLVLTVSPQSPALLVGQAYDPKRQKTFRISIQTGDTAMTTRGCVVAGLICQDMHWRRQGAGE